MRGGGPDHPVVRDPLGSSFLTFPPGVRLIHADDGNLGVTYPQGFLAGAAAAGIKESGSLDVGVMTVAPEQWEVAVSAAVFTRNAFCAAPVVVSRSETLPGGLVAVVMNSGNANACTGHPGLEAARAMQAAGAEALGLPTDRVGIASTGIIGQMVDTAALIAGVGAAAADLSPRGGPRFAQAIRTTDRFPKECALEVGTSAGAVRLAGAAKGAGMIAPGMATMLCAVTGDVRLTAASAQEMLAASVADTFNRVTVDGRMSTNDTVFFLASGASGVEPSGPDLDRVQEALQCLLLRLALMMVADGEGGTKVMRLLVQGAENDRQARAVARAVSDSSLVKTAMYGQDPNWGRIVCAAGSAAAGSRFPLATLEMGGVRLMEKAEAVLLGPDEEQRLRRTMAGSEIDILLDLGVGLGTDLVYFADLGYEYVTINAEYHT